MGIIFAHFGLGPSWDFIVGVSDKGERSEMTIPVNCAFGPERNAPLDQSGTAFPTITDRTKPTVSPKEERQICSIASRITAVPPSPPVTAGPGPDSKPDPNKTYYVRIVPHHPGIADAKISPDQKQCLITVGEKELSKFTPEERAFILSHEKAHCDLGARPPQIKENSPQAVNQALAQSRQQELAADQLGRKIAAQAGFDPDKSKNFFNKLQKIEQTCDREFASFTNKYFFSFLEPDGDCTPPESTSDHPNASTRLNNYEKDLPSLRQIYQQARTKILP
jgi:peptidase M48-like protein